MGNERAIFNNMLLPNTKEIFTIFLFRNIKHNSPSLHLNIPPNIFSLAKTRGIIEEERIDGEAQDIYIIKYVNEIIRSCPFFL